MTNFSCSGNRELFHDKDEMNARIREAKLSFLSGHASLSWYGMPIITTTIMMTITTF